jgi:dihydrofolate reductase
MRKLIASINITVDGYCDHTYGRADEEIHAFFTDLMRSGDAVLYGRITYQLMEFWPPLVKNPSGNKAMDEFAVAIDNITKIVYSRTLKDVSWRNTELKREIVPEEIIALKQQPGKDIFAGSPSLIVAMANLGLIDEYILVIHPTIAGRGLPLFKNLHEKVELQLLKTKTFGGGQVAHYYAPEKG